VVSFEDKLGYIKAESAHYRAENWPRLSGRVCIGPTLCHQREFAPTNTAATTNDYRMKNRGNIYTIKSVCSIVL